LGRFAARGTDRFELGPAPTLGWAYEPCRDMETGTLGAIVDMGGRRWLTRRSEETDDSYPAIYAFVESEVRVRLGRVIDALGDAVIQANTDGLIVAQRRLGRLNLENGPVIAPRSLRTAERVAWTLEHLAPLCEPLRLRVKARHAGIEVHGPQSYILPTERRLSGIPRQAELLTDAELARLDDRLRKRLHEARAAGGRLYRVTNWPKLPTQLERGDPGGYVRRRQYPVIGSPAVSGWVLTDGRVLPVEFDIGAGGENVIVSWGRSGVARRPGDVLADQQIPVLEGHV
jgi:hypothetical protein